MRVLSQSHKILNAPSFCQVRSDGIRICEHCQFETTSLMARARVAPHDLRSRFYSGTRAVSMGRGRDSLFLLRIKQSRTTP